MQITDASSSRLVTSSGIVLTISRLADGAETDVPHRARRCPGAGGVESFRRGQGPRRRPRQGHRRQALRLRFPRGRHAGLAREDLARAAPAHARTPRTLYQGLDLGSHCTGDVKPAVVVTAQPTCATPTSASPDYYADADLFCPVGKTPHYLGQPVALLIFDTFDAYDRARDRVARQVAAASSGARPARSCVKPYGANRFTRVAGPRSQRPRRLLAAAWPAGPSPIRYQKVGNSRVGVDREAARRRQRAGLLLRRADPRRARATRSGHARARPQLHDAVDRPVFLEPEAASPGTTRRRRTSRSCSACSRRARPAESARASPRRGARAT